MCYVLCFIRIPSLKSKASYRIGKCNARTIMIKIKSRPISTFYYLCNTNQISINIYNMYFFLLLLFFVLLYYFRLKNPKFYSSVLVYFSGSLSILHSFWLCKLKTFLNGDIKTNPGPWTKKSI